MNIKIILSVFCFSILLSCCKQDEPEEETNEYTFVVYLGGENNLYLSLEQQLSQMTQSWNGDNSTLIFYSDSQQRGGELSILKKAKNGYTREIIRQYGPQNSADPATLQQVMSEVLTIAPARHFGLFVSSHASGWLPEGTLSNPNKVKNRSIILDDGSEASNKKEMELFEFAAAIPDDMFDFMIFDMCFMSGAEVAYAFRNKTDYILASSAEMIDPGFLPVYASQLSQLKNNTRTTLQNLIVFGEAYMAHIDTQSGVYKSTTVSIIDTKAIEGLSQIIKNGKKINFSALSSSVDVWSLQRFDRPGEYNESTRSPRFFDLMQVLEYMLTPESIVYVRDQMQKVVPWKKATTSFMIGYSGFYINRHCGLTTYIEQPVFPVLNREYYKTEWYEHTYKP